MYRYRWTLGLRIRPLEAAAGMVSIFRGLWGTMWPGQVYDPSVVNYVVQLVPVRLLALTVLLGGLWQFRMAYIIGPAHYRRIVPVIFHVVTVGYVATGYLIYDYQDIAVAFYIGIWLTQVWIWGDLRYARTHPDHHMPPDTNYARRVNDA